MNRGLEFNYNILKSTVLLCIRSNSKQNLNIFFGILSLSKPSLRYSRSANNSPSKIQLFLQERRKLLINSLLVLVLVLVPGAFLRFYQLGPRGVENVYYAAAVKSMLLS